MTKSTIALWVFATLILLLVGATVYRLLNPGPPLPAKKTPPATLPLAPPVPTVTHPGSETSQGFLYGRIATVDGTTFEGRLRWGGDQEAFWGDYFNGVKHGNSWVTHVPPERRPKESDPLEILGVEISRRERPRDLGRRFMARFGDIARIEAHGKQVKVTLKSGTAFDLERFEASDFDDGVRVWDAKRGVVNLDSLRIRKIELLPAASVGAGAYRLHGTVHTRKGDFSGFIQWDREEEVGSDELDARTADGPLALRFDTIASIARQSRDSSQVTLLDGRKMVLSGTNDVDSDNRGIYVDDPRYGRVLVSWDAFERVDFAPAGSGPSYSDFPTGRPLTGTVTTRAGSRLAGRLVFDLDESETTETLDAPADGIDYTLSFGLIASIVPGQTAGDGERAKVTLRSGEELQLEPDADLGEGNAGLLVFVEGQQRPEYVPWTDVAQVDLAPAIAAPATGAPPGGR